jgi:hypothetical protein
MARPRRPVFINKQVIPMAADTERLLIAAISDLVILVCEQVQNDPEVKEKDQQSDRED